MDMKLPLRLPLVFDGRSRSGELFSMRATFVRSMHTVLNKVFCNQIAKVFTHDRELA